MYTTSQMMLRHPYSNLFLRISFFQGQVLNLLSCVQQQISNDLMYRASTIEQSQSLQRDALISALKKELYDLQDKEHEYITLTDEANNCEARYSMLKDQKDRIQNQHRIKADINRKNIAELRTEIDNLKIQIHKCSVSIEDILRESQGLKRACDNRENEIASMMGTNQDTEAKNQQLEQENKATFNKIKGLKDERNKIDSQNQRLQRTLEEAINTLKSLEKEARFLDSSNNKLSSMLIVAEKDHSDLIVEMKTRDDMVNVTHKKLDQLNRQIEELKEKINKLEKQCIRNEQELKTTSEQLESMILKNKQQTKRIKQAEGSLRGIENDLDKAVLDRDALEIDYAAFNDENRLLNAEIDSVLLQIIECEKINNEMKKEIQNYILYDEEARSMLDRKAAMRNMLETVNTRLGQTGSHISHLR